MLKITKTDPFTGTVNTLELDITDGQVEDWTSGTLIQKAMPNLSPDEREFLISGIMPDSWDSMFEEED